MASLPTGTVTFLFTDIEGSTRIWEREPDRMRVLLAQHDSIVRQVVEAHGGQVLVDGASADLIGDAHRDEATLRLLGEHRLRDLQAQEKVFQVVHPQLPESFPPLNTLDIAFRRGVVRAVAISGVVVMAL